MSDIMRPMSFDHLMTWILDEYESQQTIFGQRRLARLLFEARSQRVAHKIFFHRENPFYIKQRYPFIILKKSPSVQQNLTKSPIIIALSFAYPWTK